MNKHVLVIDEQEFYYDWVRQREVYGGPFTDIKEAEAHLEEVARVVVSARENSVPITFVEIPGCGSTIPVLVGDLPYVRFIKKNRGQMNAFEGGKFINSDNGKDRTLFGRIGEYSPGEVFLAGLYKGACVLETARIISRLPGVQIVTSPSLLLEGIEGRKESVDMFYQDFTNYLPSTDDVIERMTTGHARSE